MREGMGRSAPGPNVAPMGKLCGCSGALIAAQWIITAGHCFRDANGVRVERPVADVTSASIGRADVNGDGPGHVATVVAVRQSPTADVSIAKLDQAITDIRPIRLSRTAPEVGRSCPPMRRSSVVFPQPLPPMIATTRPRSTRMVTPLRTGRRP